MYRACVLARARACVSVSVSVSVCLFVCVLYIYHMRTATHMSVYMRTIIYMYGYRCGAEGSCACGL